MKSEWQNQKQKIVDAAKQLSNTGLIPGSSGNISIRLSNTDGNELIAITPSRKNYQTLTADDIVVIDSNAEPVEGEGIPSSESLMHIEIYRARKDVNSIVHTHGEYCCIAAAAGLSISPIIDEMAMATGGAIEVSEYGFPGSEELAVNVRVSLGDRGATLVRNHGAVAVGRDILEAVDVAILTERMAKIFVLASLLHKATPLPLQAVDAEVAIYRLKHKLQNI